MKRAFAVILVLLIGLFALGWWLNWYNFTTSSTDQNVKLGLTINKEVVKEHEEKAKEKITEAGNEIKKKVEGKPDKTAPEKEPANQDEYLDKTQARLQDLDRKIEALKAKAVQFDDKARARIEGAAQEVQAKRDELQKKLDDFKTRTAPEREKLKKGIDDAMDSLQRAYEKGRDLVKGTSGNDK